MSVPIHLGPTLSMSAYVLLKAFVKKVYIIYVRYDRNNAPLHDQLRRTLVNDIDCKAKLMSMQRIIIIIVIIPS